MKKTFTTLALLLALLCLCMSVSAEKALPQVGDTVEGFTVTEVSRFDLIGADLVLFSHDQTGAQLLYIANDDTNRTFEITFRTPALDDTGTPHVFEHSTLDGSEKFPSAALFFNLSYQTYNTYMNAGTYNFMTTYPVASLSEAQLLAYADYYTDSCLHPILMNDESIFREEAWRYSMNSPEDPLTITGTVYSEMQGAMDLDTTAYYNFMQAVMPGSTKANESGGLPSQIPNLTYQALRDYHDAYYHPSNSLTCLYGSYEDYTAFLKLLDGYFSAYEKQQIVITDDGYTPITEPVELVMEYPLESGAGTDNASVVYYGIVCTGATRADVNAMDLLTTLLADSSSAMAQTMKERFPACSFSCYIDDTPPEPVLVFVLQSANAEDAPLFRQAVDDMLIEAAQNGFNADTVDAIEASVRMDTLLIGESTDLGVSIIPSIAFDWALYDDIHGYEARVDNQSNFAVCNSDGTFTEVINRLAVGNPRTALVTTVPAPGLKEQQDAELAARLAEVKAGMTEDEINAIVAQTAALAEPEEDDASAYVAQLQAVTVESLPEEIRLYDISDTTENGVRCITAETNTDGVGIATVLLDASGLELAQLHDFKLFTDLLGELDTAGHTRAQLASLSTRYLYDGVIRVSMMDSEDADGVAPYLRATFTALDEDLEAGYDVLYEILYDSDVTDVQRLKDTVSSLLADLKKQITASAYAVNVNRAYGRGNAAAAAYSYVSFLPYYDYLLTVQERLETEPETVVAALQAIQQYLHNSAGVISAFAGSTESAEKNRAAADAFLARLDNRPIQPQTYSIPALPDTEALIIDSSVQYNLIFSSYADLGLDGYDGALDAVTALVLDSYLYPMLRDQYGVYSVFHFANDYGVLIETYRDTNIIETLAVYAGLPEAVRGMEVTQEDLDNYILSSYSAYALGTGELSGAQSAILDLLSGHSQQETLDQMRSLKALTVDSFQQYSNLYAAMIDHSICMTAGGAGAIGQYSALYDVILDPFGASQIQLPEDLLEDSIFASAAMFCRENGLMTALSEDCFGVGADASVGDLALAMYALIGGDDSLDDAMETLAAYGILSGSADDALTREDLAVFGCNFLAAVGIPVEEMLPEGFDDAAEADEAALGALGFCLSTELMLPAEDGTLSPKSPATRGEVALFIQILCE